MTYEEKIRLAKYQLKIRSINGNLLTACDVVHEAMLRDGDPQMEIINVIRGENSRILAEKQFLFGCATEQSKECKNCREIKESSEFYVITERTGRKYLMAKCKECANAYSRKYYKENIDKIKKQSKKRRERALKENPLQREIENARSKRYQRNKRNEKSMREAGARHSEVKDASSSSN